MVKYTKNWSHYPFLNTQFSSVLSTFTLSCNKTPELFSSFKTGTLETLNKSFPLVQPLATILLLYVSVNLTALDASRKRITQYLGSCVCMCVCDWLISVSVTSSRFIHVVTVTGLPSFVRLRGILLYVYYCVIFHVNNSKPTFAPPCTYTLFTYWRTLGCFYA